MNWRTLLELDAACLFCQNTYKEDATWRSILGIEGASELCPACRKKLHPLQAGCAVCQHPVGADTVTCPDCKRHPEIDFIQRSLYPYDDFMQEIISTFKYRGDAVLATLFSPKLAKLAKTLGPFDLHVPIPLHHAREWERGFNQAELLGADLPLTHVLSRPEATRKKSKLTRDERHAQKTLFSVETKVDGARILLIDDIYTTGATFRSAASVLYANGARSVRGVTVARAIMRNMGEQSGK
ncbi:ComF family protein [Paenalkalicoccus suaedae]|uniref:ComF family protein n=1 Tax=Paenalkalicoccus suaedae TaxID=2592382 RepID=A0A859FI74_9BACI|nr:ComF family protein [Paenalkalicoccus suaedae]QKS72362.1 ComF family protein [Paenalkalicoccus suaedae]